VHSALERLDANRLRIRTPANLDIVLYANEHMHLDAASVDEIRAFATVTDTLAALSRHGYFADAEARLDRVVLTPDFHRGAGIPVGTVLDARGFVLPKAVGTDIGCGMRLLATDVTAEEMARVDSDDLDARLRYIFFEGGRALALKPHRTPESLRTFIMPPRHPMPAAVARSLFPTLSSRQAQACPAILRSRRGCSLAKPSPRGLKADSRRTQGCDRMPTDRSTPHTALVADIGGTNARFAVANLQTLELANAVSLRRENFPSLEAVAESYLRGIPERPGMAAIAVAAPVVGDTIRLTNSPWSFRREKLRAALGLDQLLVLNDFEALAHALPHLRPSELQQIGGGAPVEHAPKMVLGPGTGLGVAGLVWSPAGWVAIASEGGHTSLPVADAREFAMLERLVKGRQRLSVEHVVSGPGLAESYRVLAEMAGQPAAPVEAPEVVQRALDGRDPCAREALERFATWLGRFAGDAALFLGARGGVYIGGGIAPKMVGALSAGGFRRAFEAKGRMTSYLASIPAYVIMIGTKASLKGAAAALAARR
jgi:glucokinase